MSTLVLGLGNLLLGDEGVGVHVARALAGQDIPADVEVQDVGTAVLDALPALARAERIVVVDAVQAGGAPGTVYRVPLDAMRPNPVIASMHGFDLCRTLALCGRDDGLTAVVIGVEPERIEWSLELSPVVQAVMPEVVAAVRREACADGRIS